MLKLTSTVSVSREKTRRAVSMTAIVMKYTMVEVLAPIRCLKAKIFARKNIPGSRDSRRPF